MSMTEEEKESLELECANCKVRCREAWEVLKALEKITKTYLRIHDTWRKRFEEADLKLALEFRVTRERKKDEKDPFSHLSKAQIMAIVEELGEEGGS